MNEFHWDYEVFLFIGVVVTLTAWLWSKFKRLESSDNKHMQTIVSVGSFFPILLVIFSFRSFAYEPFRIPSSSMMPTLLTGDFIYVDKTAYGVKLPIAHNTVIETGKPQRGDVKVFRSVEDSATDVIKRVVGIPGDHIKYDERTKQIFVNGEALPETFAGAYTGFHDDINPDGLNQRTTITGDVEHKILHSDRVRRSYAHHELVVPEGHYFGMGDNRDFSADSRVWGLIPEKNIVGQAKGIWMHWRPSAFIDGLKRIGTQL